MKNWSKSKSILMVVFSVFLLTGCTKEKAEALKFSAEQFMQESVSALESIKDLIRQSVSVPALSSEEEIERIAEDIEKSEKFGAAELDFVIGEGETGQQTLSEIDKNFAELEKKYYLFASAFQSLPKGSLFSREAVKKAEKHALDLTLELINYSEFLEKYPVRFTAKRTLILDKIERDREIQDEGLRRLNLKIAAKSILELRDQETKAKEEALRQCLKAAESGKLVLGLIRDFDTLNVEDMISLTRESLSFTAEISGSSDITALLERYRFAESQIREDPYWKEVLKIKVQP